MSKVSFGVFLPFYAFKDEENASSIVKRTVEVVRECERLGFHSVWIDDHLMHNKESLLECWTTLSMLASLTRNIRLGTMVTSNGFRNPTLLGKMAATVDVISDGRLEFGIGAGIGREEHEAYGFGFQEPKIRVERLGESLEIIKRLWTEEKVDFSGEYFQVVNAFCEPKPIQKPHIPITVGGNGEKYLLRVTAQYANRFDFGSLPSLENYKHKLDVLKSYCEVVGRDFSKIEKSCWPIGQIVLGANNEAVEGLISRLKPEGVSRVNFEKYTYVGKADEFVNRLMPFIDLGVTHFMLFFLDLPDLGGLRLFSEAVAKRLNC